MPSNLDIDDDAQAADLELQVGNQESNAHEREDKERRSRWESFGTALIFTIAGGLDAVRGSHTRKGEDNPDQEPGEIERKPEDWQQSMTKRELL